jgi:hypothetical protein
LLAYASFAVAFDYPLPTLEVARLWFDARPRDSVEPPPAQSVGRPESAQRVEP